MHPIPTSTSQPCDGYRFDSFEVRVEGGILFRSGVRIRIQEIPFQMLIVLLEQPGRIVSREELRKRLWDEKTFVDFDNNLRVAAAKLREALSDGAISPRFIETVARRGYRFIGEASPIFDRPPITMPESVVPVEPNLQQFVLPSSLQGVNDSTRGSLRFTIALCSVVLLFLAGTVYLWHIRQPLIHSHDSITIGSFLNNSGNHNYDDVLAVPFRIKMEESPYLSLVSRDRFVHLLKETHASLAAEIQACRQANAQALLTGELTSRGEGYALEIDAWRCSNGQRLGSESATSDSQSGILDALGHASERMRVRLGESDESLRKFNVPLVQATTSSVAALNAFRLGEEKHAAGLYSDSQTYYKLAIEFDPQFALAYLQLGRSYSNAGETSLSRVYAQKAFDLRERTSDREKLYISSAYYSLNTGELLRAIAVYQLWMNLYPRDIVPVNNLAVAYITLGQPQKAVVFSRRAIELDPSITLPYAVLAQAYLRAGDYTKLNNLCNDTVREAIGAVDFHVSCYKGAFVQNDEAAMQRQVRWAQSSPQQSAVLDEVATAAFYRGRLGEANRIFEAAQQNAISNNLPEFAAEIVIEQAGLYADIGLRAKVVPLVEEALRYAPNNAEVQAAAASALVKMGQIDRAEVLSKKVDEESPLNTLVQFVELPTVKAAIHLQHHLPDDAIKALEPGRPYDLVAPMGLSPGYYRGLAYLQGHDWQQASDEFRNVLDHQAVSPVSPYIVLSQLELGHALQLGGNTHGATDQFHQVEEIWKSADVDFPPMKLLHIYERTPPQRR